MLIAVVLAASLAVTIPPLGPMPTLWHAPQNEEEAVRLQGALAKPEEDVWEDEPEEESWQISHLVSTATYTAGPDAGGVTTGRMKIT